MNKLLFKYHDLEIYNEDGRFFAIYDAGAHQVAMRKDEISQVEAELACEGIDESLRMLFELQKRLIAAGIDPYVSNWPRRQDQDRD